MFSAPTRSVLQRAGRLSARPRTYATTAAARERVRIVEVGPRDGLQNESAVIPPEVKAELVNRLTKAGMDIIESGSFVSPKWVPQVSHTAMREGPHEGFWEIRRGLLVLCGCLEGTGS